MNTGNIIVLAIMGALLTFLGIKVLKNAKKRKQDCTSIVQAEIYDYYADSNAGEEDERYYPKIKYTVNEVEYTAELSSMAKPPTVGTKVDIKINPNKPSEMVADNSNQIFGYAFLIAGLIMFAVVVYGFFTL